MGSWNITGIILGIGLFFTIFSFILAQINVVNPYTGGEDTIFSIILNWLLPF